MYVPDETDRVIEIEDAPQSSIGAPLPIVLSDEHKLLLAYILQNTPPNRDQSKIRIVTPATLGEDVALIEFRRYRSFMFGMPNDEAFHGHPLANRGLHPHGVFEIENSSWIKELEKINSAHPYHQPQRFENLKHYIFAFHDPTFECVAENFTVSLYQSSLKDVISEMQNRLGY